MGQSDNRTSPGRTAAITGASSGLGAVFARRLAQRGYDLLLTAHRENLLAELGQKLRGDHSVGVELLPADLSKADQVEHSSSASPRRRTWKCSSTMPASA